MSDQDRKKKNRVYPSASVKESLALAAKSVEKQREESAKLLLQEVANQQVTLANKSTIEESAQQTQQQKPMQQAQTDHVLQGLNLEGFNLDERSLDEHKLDEHNLDERKLDERNLDEHNLDEHNLDEHSLDERKLDEHNLDEHNLDKRSLDERNLDEHNLDERNTTDIIKKAEIIDVGIAGSVMQPEVSVNNEGQINNTATSRPKPEYEPITLPAYSEAFLVSEMIEAYVNEYNVLNIYEDAYKNFTQDGYFSYKPSWSLFALLGGPFYLIYRNMTNFGLILALITMVVLITMVNLSFIPLKLVFAVFLLTIFLHCITGKYFALKKFRGDFVKAGFGEKPQEEVLKRLSAYGKPDMAGATKYAFIFYAAITLSVFFKVQKVDIIWKNIFYIALPIIVAFIAYKQRVHK